MKNKIPMELQGYKYDQAAELKHNIFTKIFSFLALICLLGSIVSFIYFRREEHIFLPFFVGLFVVIPILSYFQQSKRSGLCRKCHQKMQILDVPVSVDQMSEIVCKMCYLKGADNYVYHLGFLGTGIRRGGAGHRKYVINRLTQRWLACNKCRLYFLGSRLIFENIFHSYDGHKYRHAIELLKMDPMGIKKIEE